MPDELRTSIFRSIGPMRIVAAGASAAVAAGVAALMVFAATSVSGASTPESAFMPAAAAPKPGGSASVRALTGLPAGVAIVDGRAIGEAVRFVQIVSFGEALAQLPPPSPVPAAPVIAQVQPTVAAPQLAAPAPTATPEPPAPPPPPTQAIGVGLDTSAMNGYEQGLFEATNARRNSQGLAPLQANGYLVGVARIRSQDMATNDYFAHTSPVTGDTAFSLMTAYGVPFDWAGENLAMNNYPAAECVGVADQALWDSPPHRENILNPNYTDMGIGLSVSPSGMYYFTILFTGPV